jgi:hypothetical protein
MSLSIENRMDVEATLDEGFDGMHSEGDSG